MKNISSRPETLKPDLSFIPDGNEWRGKLNAVKVTEKEGGPVVGFDERLPNLIWMENCVCREGIIEFDAKGQSGPPQSSFVGVAFRIEDIGVYDVVYFRPFNFRADDPDRKAHAVQYASEPKWPWPRLRKERPGEFEKPIEPAPDGDAWFHAKVVLENRYVKVFVNGGAEPSLVVPELSDRAAGSIGLWCNGYGLLSNLQITLLQ